MLKLFSPYLPQIQAQDSNVVKLVNGCIGAVLRIVDLWVHPRSFVVRIVYLLGFPFSLDSNQRKYTICIKCCPHRPEWHYTALCHHGDESRSWPCTRGWGSWQAPILHPCPRPNPQASWHRGQGCFLLCPSPAVQRIGARFRNMNRFWSLWLQLSPPLLPPHSHQRLCKTLAQAS